MKEDKALPPCESSPIPEGLDRTLDGLPRRSDDRGASSRTSDERGIGFREGMSYALDACIVRISTARRFGHDTGELEILCNLLIRKLDAIEAHAVTPEKR